MKKIGIFIFTVLCIGASPWADTLIYTFENGMEVSGTTTIGTTDITWNPKNDPVAGDSTRAYDSITLANDLFLINSRANDKETDELASPGAYSSYFEFSLTAESGQQLDLSAAGIFTDFAAYEDVATTYIVYYRVYTSTSADPATWTQQGSRRELNFDGTGTEGDSYNTGFTDSDTDAAVAGYSLVPADTRKLSFNRSMVLSDLGMLADGEDLNVRLVVADTRLNNANFYSSIDNLEIRDFSVIGTPILSPVLSNPTNRFTDANGSLSVLGETNHVQSVLLNSGGEGSNVTVTVSADAHPEYFIIAPTNRFDYATITMGEFTNEFSIFVNSNAPAGDYTFSVDISTTDTNATATDGQFTLSVEEGIRISDDPFALVAAANEITTNTTSMIITNRTYFPLVCTFSESAPWLSIPDNPLTVPPRSAEAVTLIGDATGYSDAQLLADLDVAYNLPAGPSLTGFQVQFDIGQKIDIDSYDITVISGGIYTNEYEPGETLEITVVSTNNGANPVSNIVNSLSGDTRYFSITPQNGTHYPYMAVGDSTSTTYRVFINPSTPHGAYSLSAVNQAGALSWGTSIPLDIFAQADPEVSPLAVTLRAAEGLTDSERITITNSGNIPVSFSITDDSSWGVFYTEAPGNNGFSTSARTPVTLNGNSPETAGISDAISFGFNFPFYGTQYNRFYIMSDGVIGLSNSTDTPAPGRVTLPSSSGLPLIAPFWDNLRSPDGTISYTRESSRVVISYVGVDSQNYDGGSGLEFQAILCSNGEIEFRYNELSGNLNRAAIGIQGDADQAYNLVMTPASDTSVLLTPQNKPAWVTYSPRTESVGPLQAVDVIFTMNAAGQTLGSSNVFTARVNLNPGGSEDIAVDAAVVAAVPEYSAVSSLSFTGAARQVVSVPFIITNSGTAPLDFTITDSTASSAGYLTNSPAFSWITIPSVEPAIVFNDPSASPYITAGDEGYSDVIPLGFEFPFYGGIYTELAVHVNGVISLSPAARIPARWNLETVHSDVPQQMIAAFWGDLFLDGNSTVKYQADSQQIVITWENLSQYGFGAGSNLTFQAVLRPSGDILLQYKQLDGTRWVQDVIGLRDTASRTVRADIRQPGDWTLETNSLTGAVSTQYVDFVSSRTVLFESAQIQTIRYTPGKETIPIGGTFRITITGDASGQSPGGNDITTNTTLTIVHNDPGSPDTLDITFTVTNSQQTVFVDPVAADSDGDGATDDAERIAGTDLSDPESIFTPEVARTVSGPLLSWEEPIDGLQRTYNVYWTDSLMNTWSHLATVTNGTAYLDAVHIAEPVIYYKVTAE